MYWIIALCVLSGWVAPHACRSVDVREDPKDLEPLLAHHLNEGNIAELLIPLLERSLAQSEAQSNDRPHKRKPGKKVIQVLPYRSSEENKRKGWRKLNTHKKQVVEITPLHGKNKAKPLAYILSAKPSHTERAHKDDDSSTFELEHDKSSEEQQSNESNNGSEEDDVKTTKLSNLESASSNTQSSEEKNSNDFKDSNESDNQSAADVTAEKSEESDNEQSDETSLAVIEDDETLESEHQHNKPHKHKLVSFVDSLTSEEGVTAEEETAPEYTVTVEEREEVTQETTEEDNVTAEGVTSEESDSTKENADVTGENTDGTNKNEEGSNENVTNENKDVTAENKNDTAKNESDSAEKHDVIEKPLGDTVEVLDVISEHHDAARKKEVMVENRDVSSENEDATSENENITDEAVGFRVVNLGDTVEYLLDTHATVNNDNVTKENHNVTIENHNITNHDVTEDSKDSVEKSGLKGNFQADTPKDSSVEEHSAATIEESDIGKKAEELRVGSLNTEEDSNTAEGTDNKVEETNHSLAFEEQHKEGATVEAADVTAEKDVTAETSEDNTNEYLDTYEIAAINNLHDTEQDQTNENQDSEELTRSDFLTDSHDEENTHRVNNDDVFGSRQEHNTAEKNFKVLNPRDLIKLIQSSEVSTDGHRDCLEHKHDHKSYRLSFLFNK